VSGTFDLRGLTVDFALGETEVFVAAPVVQDVDIVLDSHQHQYPVLDSNLMGHATLEVAQLPDIDGRHGVTTLTVARTDVTSRSTSSANSGGRLASIS